MSILFPQVFAKCSLNNSVVSILSRRGFKYGTVEIKDVEFRVLVIPGHSQIPMEEKKQRRERPPVPPPRYKSMPVDQDWTNAWPTAKSVTWSTLPFPVRMGFVDGSENNGIIPPAYGNAELMKIPNFLHLTPNHIKKQCAAIKKFCTAWPKELASDADCTQHFPVTVTTCDYIFDGPSLKDERARVVTLKVNLSSLNLDYHARDKLIRLAGKAYNRKTDCLLLKTDKCPLKKQNYEYLMYLLTALYKESCKTEAWEAEKTLEDMERYFWEINKSRENTVELLKKLKSATNEFGKLLVESMAKLPKNPSDEDVLRLKEVENYKTSVEQLMNEPASEQSIENYKEAVKKLLYYV